MEGIKGNGINLVQMKPRMKRLPTDDELLLLQYAKQMNGKYTPPSSAHLLSKTVYFLNQILAVTHALKAIFHSFTL